MGAGRERSVSYSSTGHGPPQPGVIRALRGSPLARSLAESRERDRRAVLERLWLARTLGRPLTPFP